MLTKDSETGEKWEIGALTDPVGWYLKDSIRDREERHRYCIARSRHTSLAEQIVMSFGIEYFGITNIASVEEVEEIEPAADWKNPPVQDAIQVSVHSLIIDIGGDGFRSSADSLVFDASANSHTNRTND